jgi:hypothetical protein
MKKTFLLGFLALWCGLSMLSAQVTIGADQSPQSFSVLELISGNDKGLRLPQLTTTQRNNLQATPDFQTEITGKAMGLTIFNITTKCVETWDGINWIENCAYYCGGVPCVPPFAPSASAQTFCPDKKVSDLIATAEDGYTLKWYDVGAGGSPLAASTTLSTGTYYVSQTNSFGYESDRTTVSVIVGACSPAEIGDIDGNYTAVTPYCLPCGGGYIATMQLSGSSTLVNPEFKWYDAPSGGSLLHTGASYQLTETQLGITGDIQENYNTFYITVSNANHSESPRKAVVIAGAKMPVFAEFNLGANTYLLKYAEGGNYLGTGNAAKAAMKYLAEWDIYKTYPYSSILVDGTIFGGLFQWGRDWNSCMYDTVSYPINCSSYYNDRYNGNTNHAGDISGLTIADYNSPQGQVTSYEPYRKHIYDSNGINDYDWTMPKTNNNLWGNGYEITASTDADAGARYNGNWYQSQIWNSVNNYNLDPCKIYTEGGKNWRVPTQDEWERLANYECIPSQRASQISTSVNGTVATNTGGKAFVWIPVKNGVPSASGWADTDGSTIGGYAVYYTAEWNAAAAGYKDGSLKLYDWGAPVPLLFLPAAGKRNATDGMITSSGETGYYWSSSVYGKNAYGFNFNNGLVQSDGYYRAFGFSVRCVEK